MLQQSSIYADEYGTMHVVGASKLLDSPAATTLIELCIELLLIMQHKRIFERGLLQLIRNM